jgi:hypothetical protein
MGLVALGFAEPAERAYVHEHCAGCADCAATLDELIVLPDLMATVDLEHAEAGLPEPSPELFRRIVAETRAEQDEITARRRRRRVAVTGVGLAAASAAVLGAVWLLGGHGQATGPDVLVASTTDAGSHVRASLTVQRVESGSEIRLNLTGVAPGERCRLIAHGTGGTREVAGWWVASYDGEATVTGHTSIPPDEIADLRVVADSGQTLLSVPGADLAPRS